MRKKRRGYLFNNEYGTKRDIKNNIRKMTDRLKFPKKKRHILHSYFVYRQNKLSKRIMNEMILNHIGENKC